MKSNIAFRYTDSIKFNPISRNIGTFREEAANAARYIRNSTDKEIIIAFSGGVESEAVCRAFIDAGIEFSVLIIKQLNNKNQNDMQVEIQPDLDK